MDVFSEATRPPPTALNQSIDRVMTRFSIIVVQHFQNHFLLLLPPLSPDRERDRLRLRDRDRDRLRLRDRDP